MISLTAKEQIPLGVRQYLSELLSIPLSRIHYNPVKRTATIELKRNRHVAICTHQLEQMKRKFNCTDVIISSPYRCVLELKFWVKGDKKCCNCCEECYNETGV